MCGLARNAHEQVSDVGVVMSGETREVTNQFFRPKSGEISQLEFDICVHSYEHTATERSSREYNNCKNSQTNVHQTKTFSAPPDKVDCSEICSSCVVFTGPEIDAGTSIEVAVGASRMDNSNEEK